MIERAKYWFDDKITTKVIQMPDGSVGIHYHPSIPKIIVQLTETNQKDDDAHIR
jgi:hypothetical protein